jgi:hypothetical protein
MVLQSPPSSHRGPRCEAGKTEKKERAVSTARRESRGRGVEAPHLPPVFHALAALLTPICHRQPTVLQRSPVVASFHHRPTSHRPRFRTSTASFPQLIKPPVRRSHCPSIDADRLDLGAPVVPLNSSATNTTPLSSGSVTGVRRGRVEAPWPLHVNYWARLRWRLPLLRRIAAIVWPPKSSTTSSGVRRR